jgi:electron transfer flavoprotein alpha subunit
MNSIFVYCELEGNEVAPVSQELLTKGRSLAAQLGVKLEAVAIGSNLDGIENQILPYGVDILHLFDDKCLALYTTAPYSAILIKLFSNEKPQIALMGATVIGRDLRESNAKSHRSLRN